MQRKIVGYHKDAEDDWVAELDCHHLQHVRHKPPFFNREWVETEEGRAGMLGSELDCVRCDRLEFPVGISEYKRTPEFTETTIPAGLLKEHNTKPGVWGLIHVLDGRLLYTLADGREFVLSPGVLGIVVPEMLHQVRADGKVRFCVAFHRKR